MADEDDQWLYGTGDDEGTNTSQPDDPAANAKLLEIEQELNEPDESEEQVDESLAPPGVDPEPIEDDKSAEEEQTEEKNEEEEDEEEDSDEDNVNVVIGDISKAAPTYSNLNVHKRGGLVPGGKAVTSKFSVEDFEAIGTINGISAVDFNMESLEDKPWRKPGADITDYFNYGFNEETWKAYLDRQKRIRLNESGAGLPNLSKDQVQAPSNTGQNPTGKRQNWETGQIHVIGSSLASRRLEENGQENGTMGGPPPDYRPMQMPGPGMGYPPNYPPPPEFTYGAPPTEYMGEYGGWRDSWPPPNPHHINPPHQRRYDEHMNESYERERERDRRDRDRERERDRERRSVTREPSVAPGTSPPREKDREREDRRERHRRSRSRERSRERNRSRSRSPSHKKHKKKSKKSERSDRKKQRSDESE